MHTHYIFVTNLKAFCFRNTQLNQISKIQYHIIVYWHALPQPQQLYNIMCSSLMYVLHSNMLALIHAVIYCKHYIYMQCSKVKLTAELYSSSSSPSLLCTSS